MSYHRQGDEEEGAKNAEVPLDVEDTQNYTAPPIGPCGPWGWLVKYIAGALLFIGVIVGVSFAATAATRNNDPVDPYSSLRGFLNGIDPIAQAEFEARRLCIQKQLQERGIDAFITEPGATMTYLSGVAWSLSERPFLLVVNAEAESEVRWVSPKFEARRARERIFEENATIETWQEDESPYELVAAMLDHPTTNFTLAVDPAIRTFITEGLRHSLDASGPGAENAVLDGLDVVRACRMRKSDAEIAILRRVNEATKEAIKLVANNFVQDRVSEAEIVQRMNDAHNAMGMIPKFALVLFGPSASFPHGTGGTVNLNAQQDMILMDCGGSYFGYESDISRTFTKTAEARSDRHRHVWETVRDAQMAALDAIRVGVPLQDVDEAARRVVNASGFGANYEFFTHRLGHGIGLEGHEEPYLVRGNDYTLTEGMTFSVEPGIYIPGELGVRLEDIVKVTADGYEVFGPLAQSLEHPFGP